MKITKITLGLAMLTIVATSSLSSCKKREVIEKDSDTSAALDETFSSTIANDMNTISDEAAGGNGLSSFRLVESNSVLNACTTIERDTMNPKKTITVNFGATGCPGNDGRIRKGSLIISFTGRYRDSLTVITIKPKDYFVNDHQVTGSKTITNKGHNSANHLVHTINANLQIIKPSGGGTITRQINRQREWIAGENTFDRTDDIYAITGSATGTNSNGNTVTTVITSPLIRNMSSVDCRRHFTKGTLEHTPAGKATRYVDFGNGACDNQAVVTINGNAYNITLK